MPPKNPGNDDEKLKRFYEEVRSERRERQKGYRDRALSILPHVCARCNREFESKKLRELTVHHKDHDHDNNPPDGSNWELLCMYCHEDEHSRDFDAQWYDGTLTEDKPAAASSVFKPFAGLDELLKKKKTKDKD